MARVGTVDERYQSYNVEMLEVTGGRFWKPYKDIAKTAGQAVDPKPTSGDAPAGMSPDLYQYRPPIDLTNRRLRAMAGALGPAYVRISGTWANTTYFADTDTPPKDPPKGYGGVLTRQQWLGAIDFSRAVDAPIVTSLPNGEGTRGADQVWRPEQARRWLAFTKAHGGTIAAAEYFNEPTMASMGGAPKGYDAAAFGRDFRVFDAFMRKEYPGTKLLAPGSVGEANADWAVATGGYGESGGAARGRPRCVDGRRRRILLPPLRRCVAAVRGHGPSDQRRPGAVRGLARPHRPDARLLPRRARQVHAGQAVLEHGDGRRGMRRQSMGRHLPGHLPLSRSTWPTRSSGGGRRDPQHAGRQRLRPPRRRHLRAQTQLLGRAALAQVHGDHGARRRRHERTGLHVYAHCLRGTPGGVALLAINTDKTAPHALTIPMAGQRYTLSSDRLDGTRVQLNGKELALGAADAIPAFEGAATAAGTVTLAPTTITFVTLPAAGNGVCR